VRSSLGTQGYEEKKTKKKEGKKQTPHLKNRDASRSLSLSLFPLSPLPPLLSSLSPTNQKEKQILYKSLLLQSLSKKLKLKLERNEGSV